MDVDRHAVDLAVDGAAVEQAHRADEILPALLFGKIGEIAHETGFDEFLGLAAMVELRGGHRIAAGDAADEDRPGRISAAGDGAVDPFVAGGIECLGEFGDRRSLATGGPPVGDLEFGGECGRRDAAGYTRRERGGRKAITHPSSSLNLKRYSFFHTAIDTARQGPPALNSQLFSGPKINDHQKTAPRCNIQSLHCGSRAR